MEDKVVERVVKGLEYSGVEDMLVKGVGGIMLKKEVSEGVGRGEKEVEGYEKFDSKSEVKEVE